MAPSGKSPIGPTSTGDRGMAAGPEPPHHPVATVLWALAALESLVPMWVTRPIARARQRFGRSVEVAASQPAEADVPCEDLSVSLVRADLDRLLATVVAAVDPGTSRPDSPALLARALASCIERVGGTGRPEVSRSPAGVHTPEYWHVRIEAADARTREAMTRLLAGGRIR